MSGDALNALSVMRHVEPVITTHLTELRMDTDEDNALLDQIREQWSAAVAVLNAAVHNEDS